MLDFSQSIKALEVTQNILILPSQPVDGDSLGSALAMYRVLQAKGKNVTVVLTAEVPEILKFMPGTDIIQQTANVYSDFVVTIDLKDGKFKNIEHDIVDNKINIIVTPERGTILPEQVSFPKPDKKYDLLLILDAADLTQLGDFYIQNYSIFSEVPSINIDHHASNSKFASINLVDSSASSTTQILFHLLKTMGAEIDADTATLLLAGIITDTGSFQNSNTTPEAFDLAGDLIDLGARQQEIIKHIYKTKQLETLKLWGKILSGIQVDEANRLMWSSVSQLDFSETGTTEKDTGDIIDDLMANAEEADVIVLMIEKADGSVHTSIRTSTDSKDASMIAAAFGGGGHPRSAGFTLYNQPLSQVEPFVVSKLKEMLGGENNPVVAENQSETLFAEPVAQAEPVIEPVSEVVAEPKVVTPTEMAGSPFMEIPKLDETAVVENSAASPVVNEENRIDQLAREFVSKPVDSNTATDNPDESGPTIIKA
jgi:phosphoesterase RecJ-like protein